MDGYADAGYAKSQLSTTAPGRPNRRADNVRESGERLVARLSAVRSGLFDLAERIGAPMPPESGENARDAISAAGFVNSVDLSLDRAHAEVGRLEALLQNVGDVI